jgi:hypothetical protein
MKNWKTTLCGVAGGIVVAVIPILQTGGVNLKDLAIGAALGALGVLAKDLNVTGGKVGQ